MQSEEGLSANGAVGKAAQGGEVAMKRGTQAALALGVGYVLGRRRKMRLTTMLAAATATGPVHLQPHD
jgi:hypothetical protein